MKSLAILIVVFALIIISISTFTRDVYCFKMDDLSKKQEFSCTSDEKTFKIKISVWGETSDTVNLNIYTLDHMANKTPISKFEIIDTMIQDDWGGKNSAITILEPSSSSGYLRTKVVFSHI